MTALASSDDIEVRLGRAFVGSEEARVEALLDDASASVRAYTGQHFELVENDEIRLQVRRGIVTLPQRPVVAVTSVADVDAVDVTYQWDAGDRLNLNVTPLNAWEIEPRRNRVTYVDVVYTHGYETIPEDIVRIVCNMALRAFGVPAESSGLQQESIAGYSYAVGSAAAAGAGGMLPSERADLDKYRRQFGTMRVAL